MVDMDASSNKRINRSSVSERRSKVKIAARVDYWLEASAYSAPPSQRNSSEHTDCELSVER